MPNIGPMELAIVLIIALVIVGPKKLPELGKSAGKGFREFKDSVTGGSDDDKPQISHAETETPESVQGEVVANRS
jgi:sec-independent protein translocase protein TatA